MKSQSPRAGVARVLGAFFHAALQRARLLGRAPLSLKLTLPALVALAVVAGILVLLQAKTARDDESLIDVYTIIAGLFLLLGVTVFLTYHGTRTHGRLMQEKLLAAERERSTRAIEESEAKYHSLFDSSAEALFLLKDTILDCNEATCRLLRCPREDIIGHVPVDFSPPVQPDGRPTGLAVQDRVRQAQAGTMEPFYWQARRKDGALLDLDVLVKAMTVGGMGVLLVTLRNVTDRQRAAEALLKAHEEREAILNGLQDVAVEYVDKDLRILWANVSMRHEFAGDGADPVGRHCYEVIHGRQEACPDCPAVKAFETGLPQEGEMSLPDGRAHLVRSNPVKDARGQVAGVVLAAVNITRRKQMEDLARRENAKLTAMISGMEEGVVFADAHNVIVEVNEYFCTFAGLRREDILGKSVDSFHHGDSLREVQEAIGHFRQNVGSPPRVIQRCIGKADMVLRLQPIYRDGQYDGLLFNAVDVSELVGARRQAEAANAAKGVFLANMSHEIRTPMTAILGYTDLLGDTGITASDRDNYLAAIRRNGEHLLGLLNDILDFSKIEAGKVTMELEPCRLPSVIADVTSMMRIRAYQRGIQLLVEYPTKLPETIQTDPARLRQALVNLVGNAIKFTERGSVRIVTRFLPGWRDGQDAVQIQVVDTGIGIAPEEFALLFKPFTQADPSTSRKYGGTGLGLTITRHIAELLGGSVSAESTPDLGSTFTLTLPTGPLDEVPLVTVTGEAVAQAEAPSHRPSHAQALVGIRVLLAEDGIDNQQLISLSLRKAGAAVSLAENGRLAVEKATTEPFDLVLMDIQMPEMDGYEATRALRNRGCPLPILALTAHATTADRDRCLAAGCDDYLTKPIDRARLIQAIASWVRERLRTTDGGRMPPLATTGEKAACHGGTPEGAAVAALAAFAPPAMGQVTLSPPAVIRSEFAADPGLAEALDGFVRRLPSHLKAMNDALANGCLRELQRLAHQIKGAGGGYGYPSLTSFARALEETAKAEDAEAARLVLNHLSGLIQAVLRGHPARPTASSQ